jgi:hypothetical protein
VVVVHIVVVVRQHQNQADQAVVEEALLQNSLNRVDKAHQAKVMLAVLERVHQEMVALVAAVLERLV